MIKTSRALILILILIGLINACDQSNKSPLVRIATNPWPGYELLFIAERNGYFKEEGLNIKLLQLASLVDVQRTYMQGRADAVSSTVIEAIIIASLTNEKLSIVLIPDYSFGGDVIISNKKISSLEQLKGKKIAVETGSLGIVILSKALEKYNMTIDDIQYVNLEQLKMIDSLANNDVDATVTYPPFSTEILRSDSYHSIFTSRDLPGEIIDTITVRSKILEQDPQWVNKFHRAWIKSLNFLHNNRQEAIQLMSDREGIHPNEFEAALNDMHLLNEEEIKPALRKDSLRKNISSICELLYNLKTVDTDCKKIFTLVSPHID